VSANQKPDYRPAPVTQRDGSKLANSNCRMASIATGLDFDTLGKKKSTGAKMRTYTYDQSGGTDSSDAKQAWSRGYGEVLDVQDGGTWDQLLADLRAFRLVHIDVWHRTSGGCVSGTGGYGHTMAVLPDCNNDAWLVSDPWCNPPKWQRISESKLRAGAEEWGRRVYGAATSGPSARDWKFDPPTRAELRRAAKALMQRYHAGGPEDKSEDPGDTGGGQRVMYTATVARPPEGDDVALIDFTLAMDEQGGTIKVKEGGANVITLDGGDRPALAAGTVRPVLGPATLAIRGDLPHYLMFIGTDELGFVSSNEADFTPTQPAKPSEPGDCASEVSRAVSTRDSEWREWLLEGAPGQRGEPYDAGQGGT
jgi:hypothetical protein